MKIKVKKGDKEIQFEDESFVFASTDVKKSFDRIIDLLKEITYNVNKL